MVSLPRRSSICFTWTLCGRTSFGRSCNTQGAGTDLSLGLDESTGHRTTETRDPLAPKALSRVEDERQQLSIGSRLYNYQWFRLDGRAGEGNRIGIVLRDTTEESRLQDQMVQAEKSGSLGVLTAGIGHELNNPLFGILGLGEAIQEEVDLKRVQSYARDIVVHGRRMAAIIRDFTGIAAREAKDQRVPVDVNAELDQALAIVQTSHDALGVDVQKHYVSVSTVNALPDQLRQAFANVLSNAVQALRGKGQLILSTKEQAGILTVTIRDSGPGIAKSFLSKVFDPFFTTKGQGEGSGLGLTVAQRIVKKFGGDIRIESQEGHGTTCIMTLPIAGTANSKGEIVHPILKSSGWYLGGGLMLFGLYGNYVLHAKDTSPPHPGFRRRKWRNMFTPCSRQTGRYTRTTSSTACRRRESFRRRNIGRTKTRSPCPRSFSSIPESWLRKAAEASGIA